MPSQRRRSFCTRLDSKQSRTPPLSAAVRLLAYLFPPIHHSAFKLHPSFLGVPPVAHIVSFLKGAALGAGALYFFDPQRGAGRRAAVRHELMQLGVDLGDEADRALVTAGHTLVEQTRRTGDWLVGSVLGEPRGPAYPPVLEDGHGGSAWRSPSRLWCGAVGSVLLFYGLGRRRFLGKVATTLGLGLLAEGLLHHSTSEPYHENENQPAESRTPSEIPGDTSPARGQAEDTSPGWKVAVP